MKLTIGKKLLGGFLFVLALLVIESFVSNSVINSIKDSYHQLIQTNVQNALLAKDLENTYLQQADAVKSYLLTGDTQYLTQYEEYSHETKQMINDMKKAFTTDEDLEVIQQLEAFQLCFEDIVDKEITFKKEGNEVGYNNLLATSSKTISNVFQGKIDALVTGQEKLMQTGSEELAASVEQTKKTVFFISLFSILIGTALAVIISRSISRPLHLLAKYTETAINPKGKINSEFPKIKSTIYEVKQLYQSIDIAFQEIKNHIHQLDTAIQTDALTGLANRRTFDLVMSEQIQDHIPFSLIFLDIDFFKKVNDTYGHLVGDDVLKFLAHTMRQLTRDGDLCFRYGGEEFAIIVPYGDHDIAVDIAERLRRKIESTVCPTGELITISLGIAIYPKHGQNANEIIAAADEAMYTSKSEGRNKTTLYSKVETLN